MSQHVHSDEGDALLKDASLRITKPRQAIARALVEAVDHPDAEQVLARARENDPSVSQATAYRTLAVLAEKGLLRTHTFDGSATRYELAKRPHHDHLIDVETGEVREFVSREIERLQARVAEEYGYEIIAHRLELYCRKAG
ncbi:MAG: Fur family transcriptional regulator [Pseudomonadota bacterium]